MNTMARPGAEGAVRAEAEAFRLAAGKLEEP
jgi:hypothetical protein